MLLWLVAWREQRSCTLSYSNMHGQQLCRRLEVQPGSLLRIRLSWLPSVRSRQVLGGGAAVPSVPAAGSSPKETSSFGPAVDQGHKSLAEMREERQVHPNMESVFRRKYSSPSTLPSAANSAAKDADMHEDEICECADCACVECAYGGLERGCREDNLAHCTLFCILHFVLCLVADEELFCFCSA